VTTLMFLAGVCFLACLLFLTQVAQQARHMEHQLQQLAESMRQQREQLAQEAQHQRENSSKEPVIAEQADVPL